MALFADGVFETVIQRVILWSIEWFDMRLLECLLTRWPNPCKNNRVIVDRFMEWLTALFLTEPLAGSFTDSFSQPEGFLQLLFGGRFVCMGDLLLDGFAQCQEMHVFPREANKNHLWVRSQEGHQGSASWVTPIITQSSIQRITEDSLNESRN